MAEIFAKGIDVSEYQGSVDFKKVKASGFDFVIIRAGYGRSVSQKDARFEENYANAKKAGLDVGAYWFSYAVSAETAEEEAKVCMEVIKNKSFEYPVYFDLENETAFDKGKKVCSEMVTAFCTALEKKGYYAGLYMSKYPLEAYITAETAKKYALWIADYSASLNYGGSYGIWQYTDAGRAEGVSGNVDCDRCYVDYPGIIKSKGLNGYGKLSEVLDRDGFKRGEKSIGVLAYKGLLKAAAKKKLITQSVDDTWGFGSGTEKATDELLKKFGYAQNGIAGKKLIEALIKALGY